MTKRKYLFSYLPQYSDMFLLGIFLLGGGTVAFLQHPWVIPLLAIGVGCGVWIFAEVKPRLFFFDDSLELVRGLANLKKRECYTYSEITKVQYCYAEIRGPHLFKITINRGGRPYTLQYSFVGAPTQVELTFFRNAGIAIEIVPETAAEKFGVKM